MKKTLKIVLVSLAVILGGYIYLMGGLNRTIEEVKNGKYLNFEDKNHNLKIGVRYSYLTSMEYAYYIGTLSENEWQTLRDYEKDIDIVKFNDIVSEFGLKECDKSVYDNCTRRKEFY